MLSRYSSIFAALILMFIASATVSQFHLNSVIIVLFLMLVAASGVYVASGRKRGANISIAAALLWIALMWLHNRFDTFGLAAASSLAGILYIGFTLRVMLRHIFRSRTVHGDLLFGAAAVYLLLGLLWTFVYNAIAAGIPGAFSTETPDFFSLLYFSLTTLTTLGYGDIAPQIPLSRIAASLEAVVGVLYTGIMVARLLGLHLAGKSFDISKDND